MGDPHKVGFLFHAYAQGYPADAAAGKPGKEREKIMALFGRKAAARQLDEKLQRIQMNFENNYKDAAQLNLKEFGALLGIFLEEGKLSEKQQEYYKRQLGELEAQLQNFTHKDQKPTWVP